MLEAHTEGRGGTGGGGRDAANRTVSPSISPSNEHARVPGSKSKDVAISRSLGLSRDEVNRDSPAKEDSPRTSRTAGVARPVCNANDTTCDSVSTMASHESYVAMALTFFSSHASPKREKTGSGVGPTHTKIGGRSGFIRRQQGPGRDAVSVEQRRKRTHEVMQVQRRQSILTDVLSGQKGPRGKYTSYPATLGAHGGGGRRDQVDHDAVLLPSLSAVQTGTRPPRTAAMKDDPPLLPDIRANRKDGRHKASGDGGKQGDMKVPVRLHKLARLRSSESPQGHPTLEGDRSGVWEKVTEIYERGGQSWEEEGEEESIFERGAADTHGEESVEHWEELSFKPYEPERPGGPNDEEGSGGGGGAAAEGGRASGRMRGEWSEPLDTQGRKKGSSREERRVSHAAAHAAAAAASAAAAAASAAAAAVAVVGPRAYSSDLPYV